MKNILITGSTDGIGKLTALNLAKKQNTIYVHGRDKEKLEATINEIKEKTGNQNIDGFVADFSNLNSVKEMAHEVKEKISNLDILINNAGVYNSNTSITKDGLDIRFSVNYFAPYLLTNHLLSILKKSNSPRVINLSSAAQAPVHLDALRGKVKLTPQNAYAQSKLALNMWNSHLAKQEPTILALAVNPGSLLNTKMVKEAFGNHWSSADKGADILEYLSIADNIADKSGMYFDNDKGNFDQAHTDAYNILKIRKLIKATELVLEK